MMELLVDCLLDTLKICPFNFLCYLVIEAYEHKQEGRINTMLFKSSNLSVLFIATLVGLLPQCGFSAAAADLYSHHSISLGVLVAIFVATSDEAVLLLAQKPKTLVSLLIVKFVIALLCGVFIDRNRKLKAEMSEEITDYHEDHCEDGIVLGALKHTLETFVYVFLASVVLSLSFEYLQDFLTGPFLFGGRILQIILSALIGFVPNCAASVFLSELYLKGLLRFSGLVSGLVSVTGVGILMLFKNNKDHKENLRICLILLIIALLSGIVFLPVK